MNNSFQSTRTGRAIVRGGVGGSVLLTDSDMIMIAGQEVPRLQSNKPTPPPPPPRGLSRLVPSPVGSQCIYIRMGIRVYQKPKTPSELRWNWIQNQQNRKFTGPVFQKLTRSETLVAPGRYRLNYVKPNAKIRFFLAKKRNQMLK